MNGLRAISGAFVGAGALMLIYQGTVQGDGFIVASGTGLLGTMVGFFVGESNGKKTRPD